MFGFIKNAIGKRPATPASPAGQDPNAPLPAPPDVVAALQQKTPAPERPAAPTQRRARMERVLLNLRVITDALPADLQGVIAQAPAEKCIIALPIEGIMDQLAAGRVEVSIGELRRVSPIHVFVEDTGRDAERAEIPLRELLPKLDPSLLERHNIKSIDLPEDIQGVFENKLKAQEVAPVAQPPTESTLEQPEPEAISEAASIAAPEEVPPPMPMPEPEPPKASPPPIHRIAASDAIKALFERPIQMVAAQAPAEEPAGLPFALKLAPETKLPEPEPVPEEPVKSEQPPPESEPPVKKEPAFESDTIELDLTREMDLVEAADPSSPNPAAQPVPEPVRPALPKPVPTPVLTVASVPPPRPVPPVSPAPARAPVSPPKTAQPAPLPNHFPEEAPVIRVPLATLSGNWPEAIREETAALPSDAVVEFPTTLLGVALKRGLVSFCWGQLRLWLVPKITAESMYDDALLNIPVQTVAPLFMAEARPSPAATRVQVDESIPAPFAPMPKQPAPEAVPAPPISPAPADNPIVAPGIPESETRKPMEIVERACAFSGVSGVIVCSRDGLLVAAKLPPELDPTSVAAFIPQVFSRLEQAIEPMRIGDLHNVAFTAGDRPWQLHKAGSLFIGAMGSPNENLPVAQLKMLATQLARHTRS